MKRRRVKTPLGVFSSVSAAARGHSVSRQCVWEKCALGKPGWAFLEDGHVLGPYRTKETVDTAQAADVA